MVSQVILRSGHEMDKDFIFFVKKATLKTYVEQTWGPWDEEFQISRFNEICSPAEFQIIQFQGKDIGVQQIHENQASIEIGIIEILPEYQNREIGTNLIGNIIHEATMKKKLVCLQVFKVNVKALKLYQRLGFKVIRETDTHYVMEFTP